MNTVEVIDRGLKCLSENLGADEAEIFITTILKERFDYTEWRHTFIDDITTFDKLDELIEKSESKDQFEGEAKVVL